MMWNQETFIKNVLFLVEKHCGGSQKAFNDIIGDRQAVTKWKKGDKPSLEVFMRIPEHFHCSIDWLIGRKLHDAPEEAIPQDLIPMMPALKYIFGSTDGGVKEALSTNIREFNESVERHERENNALAEIERMKIEGKAEVDRIEAQRLQDKKEFDAKLEQIKQEFDLKLKHNNEIHRIENFGITKGRGTSGKK